MNYKHILYPSILGIYAVGSLSALEKQTTNTPVEKQMPQQQSEQAASENPELKNSAAAGEKWLKFLDQTLYPQSWDYGSVTLKLTVPKNHWTTLMDNIRKPLGSLTSRKLIDQRTAKDPAGLPKGDYMVLLFQSSFSQKESVKELLTLVQENDGEWRVLTYQVQ